ncbi:MAG: glycosyltransferase family 4 protein [Desulfomonilaceae bacterium]
MDLKGLVVSQADSRDTSAYTHRVRSLAECLVKRSIACDFLYMKDNFTLRKQTTASFFMPLWIRTLRKYDFIYTGCEGAGQAMFFCRPFVKAPIIYDIHGDSVAQSALQRQMASTGHVTGASLRVRIVSRMAMACADYVVTVSEPHTEELIRQGLSGDRLGIIRNGVDLDLFRQLPFAEHPRFTIAYVGAFQIWQNIDNLIAAFDRIKNPNIRLLLVGFTQDDLSIKQRCADKFGHRVELVDRTDRASLINLLRSVAVFIIPRISHSALRNAFPTKFAEYAAMGRPIMVNDVDETADFVRKYDCGFVSDPSPEAMARTMEEVAKISSESLAEMGNRARRMAEENFSWQMIGDEYATLVRNIVARFHRR